jgi:hypothetical protein
MSKVIKSVDVLPGKRDIDVVPDGMLSGWRIWLLFLDCRFE